MSLHGQMYRRREPKKARNLETLFGLVRYFRSLYRSAQGTYCCPLEPSVGLWADRFSLNLLSLGPAWRR